MKSTWIKNSCNRQSSQGSATSIGLASFDTSETLIIICINCNKMKIKTQSNLFSFRQITRTLLCSYSWRPKSRKHVVMQLGKEVSPMNFSVHRISLNYTWCTEKWSLGESCSSFEYDAYFPHIKNDTILCLTMDLCTSFSKLKPSAKMSLNLFKISLCLAISVDKIHLQNNTNNDNTKNN